MPYSEFTLDMVQKKFDLVITENKDLFSHIQEVQISSTLTDNLDFKVPLALAINTEKARSELIISDILIEVKKNLKNTISLFSGINLDIDQTKNLNGFCDFIISKSPEQFFLKAPVIIIVEAKNENIPNGIGQCIAEMIASKMFNEKNSVPVEKIYGAITTGNIWKFLKLIDNTVLIDQKEYHISFPKKIIGILMEMAQENA